MKENNAPFEQYERLGLSFDDNITDDHLLLNEKRDGLKEKIGNTKIVWKNKGKSMFYLLIYYLPRLMQGEIMKDFENFINDNDLSEIHEDIVIKYFKKHLPKRLEKFYEIMINIVKIKGK